MKPTFEKHFKVIINILACSVITDYGNNRFFKIHDIDFKKKPTSTFDKDGKKITFVEYFEKFYKAKIIDMNQPLLVY